jgi:zinc/manganese transport system permease protein
MTWLAIQPLSWNVVADVREILSYDFMRHAFLAGTCTALAAGLVGYFIVLRNQVFTSDALGHVAFSGGLGGLILGIPLLVGVYVTTVAVALGITSAGGRGRGRDVAIGIVFAWVLGLGVLFLSLYTSGQSGGNGVLGVAVLFGSILGLQASQAYLAAGASLLTSALLLAVCRPLLFTSLDPDVAAARGVPTRLVSAIFVVLLALTVAESVQAVGALLIFALLVTPAAVAQRLTTRAYRGLWLSAALAVGFVWAGLVLAFYTPWPASSYITGVAFVALLAAMLLRRIDGAPRQPAN